MGLDAYEYQATYGLRLKNENAVRIRENSVKNDVLVSMHGPYYINLSSAKKETVEKSIERLFDCVVTGKLMGAYRIVFHRVSMVNREKQGPSIYAGGRLVSSLNASMVQGSGNSHSHPRQPVRGHRWEASMR